MTDDLARQFNAIVAQSIPPAEFMRLQVTELRPGYVKGAVPLEGNGNHLGTLYAGAMFGLAEIIGGALAVSSFDISRYYPVVKDLHITFRRPGRTGVTTECTLPAARIEERPTRSADTAPERTQRLGLRPNPAPLRRSGGGRGR
ncbi:MAG: uncharacterized protein JWQ60_1249 [Pseudonocardia sp.]|nr:uncharacterized protein [Pseudonocardia sp.]